MELSVIQADGGEGRTSVEVSDHAFGAQFNEALVHQVVTAYAAGARAGTRAQKNRSAVSGGGSKPWRQKGSGRARAGTRRSPLWRGGGKVFPASTQNFSQKVNRKMYRSALRSILSELIRQDRIVVLDEFDVSEPKTKMLVQRLDGIGAREALIVHESPSDNLWLAARNLPGVYVIDAATVDPVSLVSSEKVLCTVKALKVLEERVQ